MAYQRSLKIDQSKKMLFIENLLETKNLHTKEIYHLEFKRYKSMINFSVNTKQI